MSAIRQVVCATLTYGQLFGLALFATCTSSAQSRSAPLPFSEHKFLERPAQIAVHQRGFTDVLESLAKSASISILTDGVPDNAEARLDVRGSVRDVLDQVSAHFDCSWAVSKSGIVMLSRRFTDPNQRPQIHMKEMQQMVRDIHAAFQLVPADALNSSYDQLLNAIAHSFSAEQRAALEAGKLTGVDLNPQQFAWLQSALLGRTFGMAARRSSELLPLMDGMPKSFLELKPLAQPDPGADPTDPFSNAARFASYDYLYVVRGADGRLITQYMPKWSVD
jgi:hypothetical protein